MTRSKLSTKAVLLAGGIGLSMVVFAGLPAAAQTYTCPDGTVSSTVYGCDYSAYGYGYGYPYYYDYPYYGGYGLHRGGHGFGHDMGAEGTIVHHGMGFHHSIDVAHVGGDGFADRGVNVAHLGGGGFGGFHGGGGGHR